MGAMRRWFGVAAGGLIAIAVSQTAGAQVTILQTSPASQCGGDNYLGCFNASLSFTDATNLFTLSLTNTGAGAFTQIGVASLSTGSSNTVPSFTWQQVGNVVVSGSAPGTNLGNLVLNPNGLAGVGIELPAIGSDAQGNNGLTAGGNIMFSFMITSADNTFDISDVQVAVHQQGGQLSDQCGSSTKIVLTRNSATPAVSDGTMNQPSSTNPLCTTPPGGGGTGNVVPEPSTYVLLGSGLLGILGVAARRRRQV